NDVRLGDRYDELAAPVTDMGHLRHDLLLDVPGQDEDEIRSGAIDFLGRQYRYMRAGKEEPLLVGVPVDGEVEEVRPNAAVVQQRIALTGRAITGDVLPIPLEIDEESEDPPFGLLHLAPEREVPGDVGDTEPLLAGKEFAH